MQTIKTFDEGRYSGLKKLIKGLILLGMVIIVGTSGYIVLEKWGFLDALYMTVITITTVGFKEVRQVSVPGKIFTVVLIFMGIGIMAYTLGMVAQMMVDLQIRSILGRKKLGSRRKNIKDHYIICGYGRIGRIIASELKENNIPCVVVDLNPESRQSLENKKIPFVIDDATSEEVLLEAGIERAKGLVAVVLSDADNLFITMTARGLNPDLFILARADEEPSKKKLLRAGANRVVLPYLIGGQKMAHTIIRPEVEAFLQSMVHDRDMELKIEEIRVSGNSALNGLNLVDSQIRKSLNVIIVAIRKGGGEMTFNPSSESLIEADDILIALGRAEDLDKLEKMLGSKGH